MKNILIVSTDKFPNGNAGAIRQEVLAKLFKKCGYEPVIIGLGSSTGFEMKHYEGISYYSFRSINNNIVNKVFNYLLFKKNLKRFFIQTQKKFDAILVVSIPINSFYYLKKYCKVKNIPLIHDCVEWYSTSEFKLGALNPAYFKKNLMNSRLINRNMSVISISKYLESYFIKKNINTIRIPFILDVQNLKFIKKTCKNKTIFTYAGSMGKKDLLAGFIKSAASLSDELKERIEIRIFGVSEEELINVGDVDINDLFMLRKCIKIYGRVSRDQVIKNLEESDFSILLRHSNERYAMAGFPTKVVESLASSTPMFCNISSDLGEYIKDGKECIIVKDLSHDSIKTSLLKAIELSYEEKKEIQINARKCAEKNFDYRNYIKSVNKWLDNLEGGMQS